MIPGAVLMILVAAVVLTGCRYEREALLAGGAKKRFLFLASAGLFLKERVLKDRFRDPEEAMRCRALFPDKTKLRLKQGQISAAVLLLAFFGGAAAVLLSLNAARQEQMTALKRPAFGEVKVFHVKVEGLREDAELAVAVSGKDPLPEEMDAVFDRTFEGLQETVLNGNPSFGAVSGDLKFPKTAGNGIGLRFLSSDTTLLSDYGTVFTDELSAEGQALMLSVTLSYKGAEKQYELPLVLKKKPEPEAGEKEKLETLLENADREGAAEDALILPETLEGRALRFEAVTASPYVVLLLFLLLAGLMLILPGEKIKSEYRKRNAALISDYPKLLLKLETLIGAGLSIRSAFLRIVADYERQRAEGGARQYVYEEMRLTAEELKQGGSEGRAYLEFGRRIGLHSYVKLGTMLSQSVRQGISGLSENFEEEMRSAMEQKKNEALKKGEEAGTRILFPMMLMLAVVIASLVVPALMSL